MGCTLILVHPHSFSCSRSIDTKLVLLETFIQLHPLAPSIVSFLPQISATKMLAFNTNFLRVALLSSVLATLVVASPTPAGSMQFHEFEVYAPPVIAPNATSVWNVGDTQTVAWDTSAIDAQGLNTTGYLLLGYYTAGEDSEHLDISTLPCPSESELSSTDRSRPDRTTAGTWLPARRWLSGYHGPECHDAG